MRENPHNNKRENKMQILKDSGKILFDWFRNECEKVCQPDYHIIPAYVSMNTVHDKLVELEIIEDNLCSRCDWQKKNQKKINRILNEVAKKYNLKVGDYGVFYDDIFNKGYFE